MRKICNYKHYLCNYKLFGFVKLASDLFKMFPILHRLLVITSVQPCICYRTPCKVILRHIMTS